MCLEGSQLCLDVPMIEHVHTKPVFIGIGSWRGSAMQLSSAGWSGATRHSRGSFRT